MAKVNILTVDDVKIARFHWWSRWIDVAVFDCDGSGYLLQMKVSRANGKKFRTKSLTGFHIVHARVHDIGDLTQMSGEKIA